MAPEVEGATSATRSLDELAAADPPEANGARAAPIMRQHASAKLHIVRLFAPDSIQNGTQDVTIGEFGEMARLRARAFFACALLAARASERTSERAMTPLALAPSPQVSLRLSRSRESTAHSCGRLTELPKPNRRRCEQSLKLRVNKSTPTRFGSESGRPRWIGLKTSSDC